MEERGKSPKSGEISLSEKQTANGVEVVLDISNEMPRKMLVETTEAKGYFSRAKEDSASSEFSSGSTRPVPVSSPEFWRSAPSSGKPPKIPEPNETLARKRSLTRSIYSKPKSRFGEQQYHIVSSAFEESSTAGPDQISASSPHASSLGRLSVASAAAEDEDEVEICKKVELSKEKHKKVKIMTLIEWVVFGCFMGCLVASLTVNNTKKFMILGIEIWKWCVLVTVTFCGIFAIKWFMRVVVFFIEKNFLLRKKVLYFVHGLKKSVQVTIWLSSVLVTWVLLFDHGDQMVNRSKKATRILNDVTWTLVSLLIGAFLWLFKTLLLKILASNFHMNRFFDRIHEAIFHQYVLQTLSGPPLIEEAEKVGRTPSTGQLSFRSKPRKGKEEKKTIDMGKLHKMKREKVSTWTMKELVDAVTSSELSTISNALDESVQGEEGEQITNEMEAIAAAYKIFRKVAQRGCKYIVEDDLLRFMIKEEVDLVFPLFDGGAETRLIDKKALTNWVVKVYQARKMLAHALSDTKTAVEELNKLVSGIIIIATIVVWLLLIGIATTKLLVFLASQLVVAAFMFGNTCKTVFEALVFVFVMHPFDVGDRCVIDGIQMVVEEMNILTTVFLRLNNEKVYYPNSVLATKPIGNYYRSPDMGDSMEFSIDFMTPLERIGALKERIKGYLEENPQSWHPNHSVIVNEIENVNRIKIALFVNHTMNFQDWPEKNKRRSELVLEMKRILQELGIKYNLLPQTVHICHLQSESCS